MLQDKAGNIAGIIWNDLAANGEKSLKQIKKTTKLSERDICLGIGWLLREDKLNVVDSDDEKDPYLFSLR